MAIVENGIAKGNASVPGTWTTPSESRKIAPGLCAHGTKRRSNTSKKMVIQLGKAGKANDAGRHFPRPELYFHFAPLPGLR